MSMLLGVTIFFEQPQEVEAVAPAVQQFPFLKYVEFRGEIPFFYPGYFTRRDARYFRQLLQRLGLQATVHTTMYDINLATLNPYLQRANIRCYKKFIDMAASVGAEILVVHDGHLPLEYAQHPKKDHYLEKARQALGETLIALGDYGERQGIQIALENAPPANYHASLIWNADNPRNFLEALAHPAVGALVDIAHAALHGLDVAAYLQAIQPYLVEIHAHNNHGEHDDHLGLHEGVIDYRSLFPLAPFHQVPVIMEIKSYADIVATLKWLQQEGWAKES